MSIHYYPNKRPSKPYHVVVYVDPKHRQECHYATLEEAEKAHKYWLSARAVRVPTQCKVIVDGVQCAEMTKSQGMCNTHYLRFKRHGDPLYKVHKGRGKVSEAESVPAPCGARIVGTEAPRRCKLHLDCPVNQYGKCLDWSIKENFKGWVSV
jgi:hypothetical protein